MFVYALLFSLMFVATGALLMVWAPMSPRGDSVALVGAAVACAAFPVMVGVMAYLTLAV